MCAHVKERHSNYHYVDQFSKVKCGSKAEYINILNELKALSQGASLVAQWLRIRLPMQETWVRALVREDSHMPWSN